MRATHDTYILTWIGINIKHDLRPFLAQYSNVLLIGEQ